MTRVEFREVSSGSYYGADIYVLVEEYNASFQLLTSRKLPAELFRWGGFFAGSKYNFLVFGQNNVKESDSQEVFRIVQYSKDWQRLGSASIYGADTRDAFVHGGLDCAESGNELYIHTCHTMYKSSDGRNHQSNFGFVVDQEDMSCKPLRVNYVSHSFDQYILVDQAKNIVQVDLGDGHPRAVTLSKWTNRANPDPAKRGRERVTATIEAIPGAVGDNNTGIHIGGLTETNGSYVTVYSRGSQKTEKCFSGPSDVILAFTDKNTLTTKQVNLGRLCMDYWSYLGAPRLVPTSLSGGYVVWGEISSAEGSGTMYYASYSENGTVSAAKTAKGMASDCEPIVHNGKVVWYVTQESIPTFYILDASGVKAVQATAAPGATAYPRVERSSVPEPSTPPNSYTTEGSATPATPTMSSVNKPAYPELRCAGCNYLMFKEGDRRNGDLNNGGASSGFFYYCANCNAYAFCQQCASKPGTEAIYLRHENACKG